MRWGRVPLEDITDLIDYGFTASGSDSARGPKFLRITDIQDGRVDWLSVPRCECSEEKSAPFLLDEGDIVFARTGATTGKSFLLRHVPEPTVFASYLIRVKPRQSVIDPSYLARYFETPDYWAQIFRSSTGTAQGGVNASKLKALTVPLPPLAEQRHIAAILNKADALRAKRRQAIVKLDHLLRAVFLHMFGEPVANSRDWPREQLVSLGGIQTGATPPTSEDGMFEGAIPFVTPGDLGGTITVSRRSLTAAGASKSRLVPAGSVLVCCIGATIGKMGYAEMECAFNQQINAITWGLKVRPKYGYHAMRFFAEEIAHQGSSTTLPILKKSAFERLMLPVPPMGLQEEFERVVTQIEGQQCRMLRALSHGDDLFSSLQGECFSGDIRYAG